MRAVRGNCFSSFCPSAFQMRPSIWLMTLIWSRPSTYYFRLRRIWLRREWFRRCRVSCHRRRLRPSLRSARLISRVGLGPRGMARPSTRRPRHMRTRKSRVTFGRLCGKVSQMLRRLCKRLPASPGCFRMVMSVIVSLPCGHRSPQCSPFSISSRSPSSPWRLAPWLMGSLCASCQARLMVSPPEGRCWTRRPSPSCGLGLRRRWLPPPLGRRRPRRPSYLHLSRLGRSVRSIVSTT